MIIEVDTFKEKIEGYNENYSEDFHIESGKLADKEFIRNLKDSRCKRIVFMAGGTAAGKSEYAQTFLIHNDQLVYDGTLKNRAGFKVKIDKIKKYAKHKPKVKIVYIIPAKPEDALEVFLSRKRKMRISTFFETHAKSALTISQLFKETDYRIEVYVSSFNEGRNKMVYQRITLGNRLKYSSVFKKIGQRLIQRAKDYGIEIE